MHYDKHERRADLADQDGRFKRAIDWGKSSFPEKLVRAKKCGEEKGRWIGYGALALVAFGMTGRLIYSAHHSIGRHDALASAPLIPIATLNQQWGTRHQPPTPFGSTESRDTSNLSLLVERNGKLERTRYYTLEGDLIPVSDISKREIFDPSFVSPTNELAFRLRDRTDTSNQFRVYVITPGVNHSEVLEAASLDAASQDLPYRITSELSPSHTTVNFSNKVALIRPIIPLSR